MPASRSRLVRPPPPSPCRSSRWPGRCRCRSLCCRPGSGRHHRSRPGRHRDRVGARLDVEEVVAARIRGGAADHRAAGILSSMVTPETRPRPRPARRWRCRRATPGHRCVPAATMPMSHDRSLARLERRGGLARARVGIRVVRVGAARGVLGRHRKACRQRAQVEVDRYWPGVSPSNR